jgi:hypothetical protein
MNMTHSRRSFAKALAGGSGLAALAAGAAPEGAAPASDPTQCDYAPCGEYIKDHSIVFHDGWYHLFSISGVRGYYHGYNGNEETVSWSISRDLVHWEFRGHVLHATQRKGAFDQHEVWAPFCYQGNGQFYMFYTGVIHPFRPMEYRKLGHDHPWVVRGHRETQGLAVSSDLTYWDKVADFEKGLGVPGRDSFVTYDGDRRKWLLYSTLGTLQAHVSESSNLIEWKPLGVCAEFPPLARKGSLGKTTDDMHMSQQNWAESLTVLRHPLSGRWILLANWHYMLSDDPLKFDAATAREYDRDCNGRLADMGYACEILQHNGRWYRSGVMGRRDYWRLGFTEIEWVKDGAFRVLKPSRIDLESW